VRRNTWTIPASDSDSPNSNGELLPRGEGLGKIYIAVLDNSDFDSATVFSHSERNSRGEIGNFLKYSMYCTGKFSVEGAGT
jgi:hypothetical protein